MCCFNDILTLLFNEILCMASPAGRSDFCTHIVTQKSAEKGFLVM